MSHQRRCPVSCQPIYSAVSAQLYIENTIKHTHRVLRFVEDARQSFRDDEFIWTPTLCGVLGVKPGKYDVMRRFCDVILHVVDLWTRAQYFEIYFQRLVFLC